MHIYYCTIPVNASIDTTEPSELEHRYNVSEMWNSYNTTSIKHDTLVSTVVQAIKVQCTSYIHNIYPEMTGQQKSGENTESKWHSTCRTAKYIDIAVM